MKINKKIITGMIVLFIAITGALMLTLNKTSTVKQIKTASEKLIPTKSDGTPILTEKGVTPVDDQKAVVKDKDKVTTSVAKTTTPVAKATTSVAKTIAPVAKATTSVAKTITPVAKTTTSVAKTTTSVAKTTTSVAKTTTSVAKTTTSVAQIATSVAKTTTPVAKATTPVAKTTTPATTTPSATKPSSVLDTTSTWVDGVQTGGTTPADEPTTVGNVGAAAGQK